ncbi:hypothetical protein GALL_121010 [mine drainage metagenome]|uniref:Uncharacterized protein n=1 Tax=mine drainage metagenome TaxID=410659 RepID=A0A1J5SCI1_9ZZZZ
MNSNVKPSIVKIEADELKQLVTEVKETVATNVDVKNQTQNFGVADLWKIQRQMKPALRLKLTNRWGM